MAKKQATYGNYTVIVNDDNSITVKDNGNVCDNSKAALRDIAALVGFEVNPDWNTRQFGAKLVDFMNDNIRKSVVDSISTSMQEDLGDENVEDCEEDDDFDEEDDDDWGFCENVEFDNIEYSTYDGNATASFIIADEFDSEHLVIPEKIEDEDGNEYVVAELDIESYMSIKRVTLPKTLKYVYGSAFSRKNKVTVDFSATPEVVFENNIFYTKGKKVLTNTKLANIGEVFTVDEGVEEIAYDAFEGCSELKILNLPSTIKKIYPAFAQCSKLEVVNIYTDASNVEIINEDRDEEPVDVFYSCIKINYNPDQELQKETLENTETPQEPKAEPKCQPTEEDMMILDRFINAALEDFVITDEEREVIINKAQSIGLSDAELKLYLNGKIQERMKEKPEKTEEKAKGFWSKLFGK